MNKALLDTDIYSEILKARDVTVVKCATAYRSSFGVLTLSTISVMEAVRGFQKTQNQARLSCFLAAVALEEVLAFDPVAAELAGRIAGDLERIGKPIGTSDPMIAAIAHSHNLELVTGNTAHFQRVQQLGYPLHLANWRV